MSAPVHSFVAPWLLDGDGESRRDCSLVWSGDRILEVGTSLARPSHTAGSLPAALADELTATTNWGVIPGLINGHTHLEFSDLREPLPPPQPFVDWLSSVVRSRRNRTVSSSVAIQQGVMESARAGVTTIAEILTADWDSVAAGLSSLGGAVPRFVPFKESLGLRPDQHDGQIARADAHLQRLHAAHPHFPTVGLSPHAPYSVHPDLFTALLARASQTGCPVAMHLAETADEMELLATGRGPFVDFLERLGVWHPPAFPKPLRPLDFLQQLERTPQALVVHGNYLAHDELEFLAARPQLTLVYCPRTHAYFGHPPHPWRSLVRMGGRVILGTDSRASNPDLSLFEEARFLATRFPEVAPRELLGMITRQAAEALFGPTADCGRLSPGLRADLALVQFPNAVRDPWETLFHPETRIRATLIGGRWLEADFPESP